MVLHANLVIGADGSTTKLGSSKGLSSVVDRQRFHALRSKAQALIIGGNTARNEPYLKTELPLFVISRQKEIAEIAANPLAKILNQDPITAVADLKNQYTTMLLFEGGAELLNEIIKLVDVLHITLSGQSGDGQRISFDGLTRDFVMDNKEIIVDDTFLTFKRLK